MQMNIDDNVNDNDDFQDGWDDDDVDLDLDGDEESESANQNIVAMNEALPTNTEGTESKYAKTNDYDNDDEALQFSQLNTEIMDTTVEGWDEDEDILFDEIESSSPVGKEAPVTVPIVSVAPPPQKPPASTNMHTGSTVTPTRSAAPPPAVGEKELIQIASEGWGDDDDDDLFSDESESKSVETSAAFSGAEASNDADEQVEVSDGWDDDADLIFDNVEEPEPIIGTATRLPPPPLKPAPPPSPLYTALEDYLLQLPRLESSINAVLEYECNTLEKANELVQYYSERPGLAEYTIKKELPRMEYALIQGPKVVTDKKEIAHCLHQDSSSQQSLVSRCANQSLLADLLQVFTGSDLLVRPQYMAAAVAQSCRFRVDPSQSLVQVQAQLDLCLPTEHGRWKVAELLVRIDFCSQPLRPFCKYQLDAIRPAVYPNDPAWTRQLHGVVEMLGHLDLEEHDNVAMENNFRDVFLQQSQSLFQNSAVGIKSAWQEIDTVAGFSNKLGRLPRFDDVMQAAEQAAESESTSLAQERPTSILGDFFGKLAKSVALPDEDPSMYQEWQAPTPAASPAQPVLYSRSPAPSAPRLYNKNTPSPQPPPPQRPQFYNKTTPPPPVRPAVQVPKLYNETPGRPPRGPPLAPPPPSQPPATPTGISALSHGKSPPAPLEYEVEDGWDDDLDLDDDDDDESVSTPVPSPIKPHATEQQPVPVKLAPPPIDNTDNDDWVYNPANDIIPTRKRWVNPRPGSRQLRSFVTQ
jgi:hypothetical protein